MGRRAISDGEETQERGCYALKYNSKEQKVS